MKNLARMARSAVSVAFAAIVFLAPHGATATDQAAQLIRSNALLAAIQQKSPETALRFAKEVEAYLASAAQGRVPDGAADGPRFRRRGGASVEPGEPQSEMERQYREVFEANPALRKMYFHSPVAYLRMLKRLRQAAGLGSQTAAQ